MKKIWIGILLLLFITGCAQVQQSTNNTERPVTETMELSSIQVDGTEIDLGILDYAKLEGGGSITVTASEVEAVHKASSQNEQIEYLFYIPDKDLGINDSCGFSIHLKLN